MTQIDPNALALQDDWIRRVARGLVRDPQLAEDLAQDAWVAGLEKGRTGAEARPWLRGVVQNKRRALFRSSARREAREQAVARADASPPADEVVEQLQLRQRVAQALMALDEPYRTALYLRFVTGVSVREAARRMGCSSSTLSGRVHAGLARLRQQLDQAYDGDRRAWAMTLLPLARPLGLAALTSGGIPMLTASTLAIVATASGLLWLSQPHAPHTLPSLPSPVTGPATPGRATQPMTLPAGSAVARLEGASLEPTPATVTLASEAQGAGVAGRFLLPNGAPAAGATWTLEGFASNAEMVARYGLPEGWSNLSGALDSEGRVQLSFESPRAYQYTFTVDAPGFVPASWRWERIDPQETKDCGTHVLRAAGALTGRLVDSNGAPLVGRRWAVYCDEVVAEIDLGLQGASAFMVTEEADARFHFDRFPAGAARLKVYDKLFGWSEATTVTVAVGETTVRDVTLTSMDEYAQSVVVSVSTSPYHSVPAPGREHIALIAPDGSRRHPNKAQGRANTYRFDNVHGAGHRVEIDDPRFLPWARSDVSARSLVSATLSGSAALRFVVHTASGAVVDTFAVDLTFDGALTSPKRFLAADGSAPLEGGLLAGLVPADYTLLVRCPEGTASTKVVGLAAGETRTVELTLGGAVTAAGTVRFPDGTPAAHRVVQLVRPAATGDSPASPVFDLPRWGPSAELGRWEIERAFTDQNGVFALPVTGTGPMLVVVGDAFGPRAESAPFDAASGAPIPPMDLTLARGGQIEGQVDIPPALDATEFAVLAAFGSTIEPAPYGRPYAELRADGSFSLGALRPGPLSLFLVRASTSKGNVSPLGGAIDGDPLGLVTTSEGQVTHVAAPYPGPALGSIVLQLGAHGLEASPVTVCVMRQGNDEVVRTLTAAPDALGTLHLQPGTYDLWFGGDGWLARRPGVVVAPGEALDAPIELDLQARDLRFLRNDGALPEVLATRSLAISGAPRQLSARRFTTDAAGRATLRLGAGAYALTIDSTELADLQLAASVTWPMPSGLEDVVFE
ncbi:MAG: sigma-70 family RNA polymerase sigma factor [Planctomycetota bacterium]